MVHLGTPQRGGGVRRGFSPDRFPAAADAPEESVLYDWVMSGLLPKQSDSHGEVIGAGLGCAPYLSPYRCAVDRMGPCFEALLWNSPETQRLRFQAITTGIDLSQCVVLDAGCGRADLAVWMRQQGIHWRRYIGVDAITEMLEHARSLSLPHADFYHADFITDDRAFMCGGEAPDVIVFSGSLNTIPRSLGAKALARAWRDCRTALVFNFLSSGDEVTEESEAGRAQKYAPQAVLKWALQHTRDVSIRHDYMQGRDATIFMLKSGSR